jgi:hypothetical protein
MAGIGMELRFELQLILPSRLKISYLISLHEEVGGAMALACLSEAVLLHVKGGILSHCHFGFFIDTIKMLPIPC